MFSSKIDNFPTSSKLLDFFDKISDNEGKTVGIIPFGSVVDIGKVITQKVFSNKLAKKIKSRRDSILYKLEVYETSSGILSISGDFLLHKLPNYEFTYLIITIEDGEFFHKHLRPFIKSFYSEIILPFIKSTELINLIETYQGLNLITNIKITQASQRIRYHEEMSMSTVTWNNSSIEDANTWLQENNGWFKSIRFKAYVNERLVSTTFVDRRGIVRAERNFIRVFESIIRPTCNLIDNYIRLFQKRSRRDNENLTVNPLAIEYSSEIFKDVANNKKFIDIIAQLKDSSVSVLHGNPYVHLSIVDYVDASSFDLWVLNSKRILIAPQLRCSIISLKRLVNHIFDNYAEGEIKNYEI